MAARLSKYRGRSAHEGRHSRQDTYWDTDIEPVFETTQGNLTKNQFMAIKQKSGSKEQFSMCLGNVSDSVFSRRSCSCGGEIKHIKDGKAVCSNPSCSTVFNDGGNIEGLVKITRYYNNSTKPEVIINSPIKPHKGASGRTHMHRFIQACRA